MRTILVRLTTFLLGVSAMASPCAAQARLMSVEELRRELAVGDVVTVVPAQGRPLRGRLIRLGDVEFDLRLDDRRMARDAASQVVTISVNGIQSLERPRDSVRNGTVLGASIGAGVGAGMFLGAMAVDRNELDEWAPIYLGSAALSTGIGALLGWAIDAARSKPHVRFEPSARGRAIVSVQPAYSRTAGLGLTVSVSR